MLSNMLLASQQNTPAIPQYSFPLLKTVYNPRISTGIFTGGNLFGDAIVANSNYICISAPGMKDNNNTGAAGRILVYSASDPYNLLYEIGEPAAETTYVNFGSKMNISATQLIVGSPSNPAATGGKAYVFNLSDGLLVRTFNNPNVTSTASGDNFGLGVAIGTNYVVVSAPNEDTGSASSGASYVFSLSTGLKTQTIADPNPYESENNDFFGYDSILGSGRAIVMNDTYTLISTPYEKSAAATFGLGYIYVYNTNSNSLVRSIANPIFYNSGTIDLFGTIKCIVGDYVLVGVPRNDTAGYTDEGIAYLINITNGVIQRTFRNPNVYATPSTDYFGQAVAMNENLVAISATREDIATNGDVGVVYVFLRSTGALIKTIDNPGGTSTPYSTADYFGSALAFSGDCLIIGSPYEDHNIDAPNMGIAYIYWAL